MLQLGSLARKQSSVILREDSARFIFIHAINDYWMIEGFLTNGLLTEK